MSPKALESRPVVYDWMVEYLKAFDTLNATRQFGMGPNPIQLSEILAYLQVFETDDPEVMIHYTLLMDQSFLTAQAEKRTREKPGDR